MAGLDMGVRRAMAGPFIWGKSDCLLAAASAFEVLHGVDPAGSVRGAYSSPLGAARILRAAGGFEAWAAAAFAAVGLKWSAPTPGAIVLVRHGHQLFGFAAALVVSRGLLAGKGAQGVTLFASDSIEGAWSWSRF